MYGMLNDYPKLIDQSKAWNKFILYYTEYDAKAKDKKHHTNWSQVLLMNNGSKVGNFTRLINSRSCYVN